MKIRTVCSDKGMFWKSEELFEVLEKMSLQIERLHRTTQQNE